MKFECIVNEITRNIEGRKYSLHKNLQLLEKKKIMNNLKEDLRFNIGRANEIVRLSENRR